MIKNIFKVLNYFVLLCIFTGAGFFMFIYMQVSRETSELMERGAIKNTVFSESPVYYDDGVTPIGVFFEKTHSKYISYKDIPRIYIKAIIASEDKNFFRHHGFDFKAIMRAFLVNYKAGKVIQGGSTITQQTAKNIFKREKKTYLIKLKELIQAMLIEKHYSKEEILEIYINQFFVTGFGKGLGVASEYFFNKEPKDLTLAEAAFLAGMVKGPYRYNPFGKSGEEEKEAVQLAKDRKDYVLEKMKLLNMITEDEYIKARGQEVPFREGKVTYGLNVAMDYIRRQLESDYFRNILSEHGLDNIATSGINIYTSISQTIQEGALSSLRSNLPALDIQLSGYDKKLNVERYMEKMGMVYNIPSENLPFFGNISAISDDIKNIYMEVKWEKDGEGIIDYEGLKHAGEAWTKWKYGSWTAFDNKYALEFMKNFQVGDSVPVFLIEKSGETPLEKQLVLGEIPDLEGGVVVMHGDMIKAMVGGFFDRHFNRAADAKRQLGSIFKPIVYAAALQLKWSNLDALTDIHDVYQFENTYYTPRPDHDPTGSSVSMAWAGAKSENLASVWLLYHLTDRLNISEFKKVAERLDLSRRESETYQDYVKRIRDTHGVIVDETSLMDAAFEEAKKDVESDLIFNGTEKATENLNRLHFDINSEKIDSLSGDDVSFLLFSFKRLSRINSILKNSAGTGLYSRNTMVDGMLPSWVIDLLQSKIDERYRDLQENEKYDMEVLYYVRDFRTLVNLYYVRQLAVEMGVSTPLDTVLSFPLGANSISILEAALAYNTMMNGELDTILEEGPYGGMAPVITRITDRHGGLIWEYTPEPERILSGIVSGSVTEILRMAVENGTARRAKDSVKLSVKFDEDTLDVNIPAFGKTGTSNEYSNSSFAGFIPGIQKGGFSLDKGYVIASYVGYDDNRPMKGPYLTIYGASGALPIWIDTANAIVNSAEYKKDVEIADLAFNINTSPLVNSDAFSPVKVSSVSGLPLPEGYSADPAAVEVYSNIDNSEGAVTLKRVFQLLGGEDADEVQ
jgi:penicillin-binding protein 1A